MSRKIALVLISVLCCMLTFFGGEVSAANSTPATLETAAAVSPKLATSTEASAASTSSRPVKYMSEYRPCNNIQQTPKQLAARTGTKAKDWESFQCGAYYSGKAKPCFTVRKDEMVVTLTNVRSYTKTQRICGVDNALDIFWFNSHSAYMKYGKPPKVARNDLDAYVHKGNPRGECWTSNVEFPPSFECRRDSSDPKFKFFVPQGMVAIAHDDLWLPGYQITARRFVLIKAIYSRFP